MGKPTKPEMTEAEARALTDQIRRHIESAWALLARVHAGRGWEALGYGSFAAYVTEELGMARSQAYRLVDQGTVIQALNEALPQVSASREWDTSPSLVVTEKEAAKLKPVLPEVVDEIREKTAGTRTRTVRRAKEVIREHLERVPPKKPPVAIQQVLNLYPPPRTADDVRLVATRVVEQTADRLAHCCSADQLERLAAIAAQAWKLKTGAPEKPAPKSAAHPVLRPAPRAPLDPNRCPECNGLTGDAGRGQRKCLSRGCGWRGKVA